MENDKKTNIIVRPVYNLEFPSWCPEINIFGYKFTRVKNYGDRLSDLQHLRKFHSEYKIKLNTGYEVFSRSYGIDSDEVKVLLNRFTTHGKVCEPLRTAKILARAVLNSGLMDKD